MNKKEKYYKFIIDDMISKTVFDFDKWTVKFPFGIGMSKSLSRHKLEIDWSYINLSLENPDKSYFVKYVTSNYGIIFEELKEILFLYFNELFRIKEEL